ncbi:MAG: porin family protein [Bacteroidales bacterium]
MNKLKLIMLGSLCVFTLALWGQVNTGEYTEILLKTGYTVRGKVVEFVPNERLTLQTIDGSTITYPTSEIETYGKGAKPKDGGSKSSGLQINPEKVRLLAHLGFGTTGVTKNDNDTRSVFKFPALIGIGAMYKLDTLFSLHADLNFERKGYKISYLQHSYYSDTSMPVSYKQKLNYLTIPLYAGVNFPYENLIIYGQLGPYVSLLLKEKTDDDTYSYASHRSFDYGILIGVGVEIPFDSQISFRAGLRFTRSIRKISDYSGYYSSFDSDMKNKALLINGGVVYRLQ